MFTHSCETKHKLCCENRNEYVQDVKNKKFKPINFCMTKLDNRMDTEYKIRWKYEKATCSPPKSLTEKAMEPSVKIVLYIFHKWITTSTFQLFMNVKMHRQCKMFWEVFLVYAEPSLGQLLFLLFSLLPALLWYLSV